MCEPKTPYLTAKFPEFPVTSVYHNKPRYNCLLYPESQSTTKIQPTYEVILMKAILKCVAHMKDCWDPEFKPSVEDIVDYR